MNASDRRFDSGWKTVAGSALVLLVASVLPSPLGRHPEFSRFGPDKFLHFLGHTWLTVALVDAVATDHLDAGPAAVVAVVCSVGYGLLTGFLQQFVPGRVPERADLVAGSIGSVVGALSWWYLFQQKTASDNSAEQRRKSTANP